MPIGITGEHEALRDSVRDMLARRCPPEQMRAAVDADAEGIPTYWSEAASLGWLGLHLPEELGGAGYSLAELAVVIEELGRAMAPGGFVPTVHAAAVLALGPEVIAKELIPSLADGSLSATVAVGVPPVPAVDGPDGLRLTGVARPVMSTSTAGVVLVPAAVDDRVIWCAVDTAAAQVNPLDSLDPTRRTAEVTFEDTVVPTQRQLSASTEQVTALAVVMYAAEACGMAAWCLDTAAEHAKSRVQFGRPIGVFQAVKHRCADLLVRTEQMRALCWDAARSGGVDDDSAALAVAAAAALAFDAAVTAAEDCIQVLGGIGFTWEHDAHLYLRRAIAVRQLVGPTSSWRQRVGELAHRGVRRSLTVELPPDAEQYRGEVRELAESIKPLDAEQRRRRLVESGYLMPHWPKPWGREAGPLEQLVIDEEFRRARVRRPSLAIGAWVVPTLIEHGSPDQVERWVAPSMRGEVTWCQLFSEPGAGSDLAALSTRADPTDGGWLVNGQKVWTSLAKDSTHAILLARTSPIEGGDRHAGISYFLLDMATSGVDVRPLRELTGQAMFNEVFLDDVFVPSENLVGELGGGWGLARTTLVNERVQMASGASFGTGVDGLLGSVADRELDPVTQDRLGRFVAEAQSLGLLGLRSMLRALGGAPRGPEASLRKLAVAEHEQHVQEFGLELLGPEGATVLGPAAGWSMGFLATRCLTIAGGTSEVQRNVIGERLLGLPRDT